MTGLGKSGGLEKKVGLLVVSLLLALVAGEMFWRARTALNYAPATVFDPDLGWRYQADVHSRHRSKEFDIEIHTNGNGYRVGVGQPVRPRPPIVFMGDSVTFGWGVEYEESFPALVGSRFGREIVNLGIAGFATDQQYLLFQREKPAAGAAAVVLTYSANDLYEAASGWQYGWTKPRFRLEGDRLVLSTVGSRSPFLERHSSLLRSARYFRHLLAGTVPNEAERIGARRIVRRLIRAMAEESSLAGARFVVVHAEQTWLAEGLVADGVDQVDVGPALNRAAADGAVSFGADPHWNVRGHRAVADAIGLVLQASGL